MSEDDKKINYNQEWMDVDISSIRGREQQHSRHADLLTQDGGRAEVSKNCPGTKRGVKKPPREKGHHEQGSRMGDQSRKSGTVPLAECDNTSCFDQNSVVRDSQKRTSMQPALPRKCGGKKESRNKSGSKKENVDKKTELERLLQDHPDIYKKCVLSVDERGLVCAKVINAGSTELKKIGIFGLKNRGQSFPDDEVVVEVLRKQNQELEDGLVTSDSENLPAGKVIGVLNSANNLDDWLIICTVDEGNTDILKPIDRSLPSLTNVKKQKKPGHVAVYKYRDQKDIVFVKHIPVILNALMPDIFLVRYLSWKNQDPAGVVVEVLPAEEPLQHSMRILRIESRNQDGFNEAVQLEVENNFPECFTLPELELSKRLDYTSTMTFTIDLPDSKDIDDALSITEMENGHKLIGVHIADVSYFVGFESELDRESCKRGTSVYEVGGKDPIAMLPKRLSTELCSLQEGQRRLTLSVFITTNENDDIINVELKKTIICSRFRLNYFQVEAALRGMQAVDAELPSELLEVLFLLNRISQQWRKKRIGHAEFSRQTNNIDYANTPISHQIVEEMMVMANHCVAKHLLEHFPTCTPLMVQQVPSKPEIQDWRRRFPNEATIIEMVQPIHSNDPRTNSARDDVVDVKKKFVLHKPVWEEMTECLVKGELEKLQSFILSPEYHPCLIVAWFNMPSFTKKGLYVCSGDHTPERHWHFSLNLPQYTQFTSPIRRYLDLVVHRLVHQSIDDQVGLPRYTQSKVSMLCEENQAIKTRVGIYESSVKNTHFAEFLRQKPLVIHALVERAIATGFKLNCLKLSAYLKLWPINVTFLGARKVKAVQQHRRGKVILSYSLRVYDLESTVVVPSVSSQEQKSSVKLSGRRHVVYTTVAAWKELVSSAMEGNRYRIASCMEAIRASLVDPEKTINSGFQRDVSCEGNVLQSVIDFSVAVAAGDVIQVQVAGEVSRGKLVPFVQLLSLSPTVDVCLEHRSNAGKCFAQLTGIQNASQCEYEDIGSYCSTWMSLIVVESAENSVARNDSFILHKVSITWLSRKEASFQVPAQFCQERCISIFHEIVAEAAEEDSKDLGSGCLGFMCLRYPGVQKKAPETKLPIGNVMDLSDPFTWVGHCVVTGIENVANVYRIHFRLNQSSTEVPEQVLSGHQSPKATVEWISNTEAEWDTVRALSQMQRKSTHTFASDVAISPPGLPPLDKSYVALAGKHLSKIKGEFNAEQHYQIGEALLQPFSLIHGYTSSGKTLMAAQLAYRFSLMNRRMASAGQKRMQVICCCPTEGSLQSLADHLCDESLGIDVVLVCSREDERREFPLPGYLKNLKVQRKGYGDQLLKRFCLHHRIRESSSSNGDFIRLIDNKIALNQDDVIHDLSRYLVAVEEEESEILGNADVLLCFCATSVQKRIRCNTNIRQVIIDDSQACTEPETLLPLIHRSIQQVILFGDMKQLKPCVVSSTARKYGLTRSLFERCIDEKTAVLTKQYTMHESLRNLLTTCVYDSSKPSVGKVRAGSASSRFDFWPGGRARPFLFLNVVGTESQSSGHSSECIWEISNPEEARVVAEVCKRLAEKCVSGMDVVALSPYENQCLEIRKHLKDFQKVAISSINSAQGKHWSYVVLSTVRSQPPSEKPDKKWLHNTLGVLCAKNMCSTLLSRANDCLIIIGNKTLLECDDFWRGVIHYFEKYDCVMESSEFLSSVMK